MKIIDNINCGKIEKSLTHGSGLFCSVSLNKNYRIATLDGQLLEWSIIQDLSIESEWNAISKESILYRPFRTKYYYINHSREPNLFIRRNRSGKIDIYTLRKILAGEEFLLDYRKEPLPDSYLKGHGSTYL